MNIRSALAQPYQINEAVAAALQGIQPPVLFGSSLVAGQRCGEQGVPCCCNVLWRACSQAPEL